TIFGVTDIQDASIDLLQRGKRSVTIRFGRGRISLTPALCKCRTDGSQLGGRKGDRGVTQKASAVVTKFSRHSIPRLNRKHCHSRESNHGLTCGAVFAMSLYVSGILLADA